MHQRLDQRDMPQAEDVDALAGMEDTAESDPTAATDDDRVAAFTEWQQNQYVPGYYTGGNAARVPYLRGRRPNPIGYVLLFVGGLGYILALYTLTLTANNVNLDSIVRALFAFVFPSVLTASGIALLRKRS